jgi:putative transposase
MIVAIRRGLKEEGVDVSISRLRHWFDIPRRTVYYRPTKKTPVMQRFAGPIKQMIEENPSFGYRTVAHLLKFNKNTVQRIFQLKHWQVRKRPVCGRYPLLRRC